MNYECRKPRDKLVVFFILALCSLFIPERAFNTEDKNKAWPKIEFDAVEKNHGKIAEGDDKTFEFVVKNVGNSDLRILRLRSLCDCVEVTIDKTKIRPGGSAVLQGIFISAGRWGDQEKLIIVSSNAQNAAQAKLMIRLVVESGVRVTPRSFSFGEIEQNRSATKKVKIEARLADELDVEKMNVISAENVTAKILRRKVTPLDLPSGQDGYLTEIDIMLEAENDSAGEFSGQLDIHTNSDRNSRIEILFSGEKTGDLEANPKVVYFKDVIPGHTAKTVATIKSLRSGPFRVTGLNAGQLPITMEKSIDKDLHEHDVELAFTAPEKPRRFYRGYVYIITNHSTQNKIKVGINAVTRHTAQ